MITRILTAAALATALATTAFAAGTTSNSTSAMNNGSNANANVDQQTVQNLPQEIRQKLTDDGFTDVKVVPGSFIVSAKDKRGEPVTMLISPNSMMMVTEVPSNSGSSTTHQK